MLDKAPLMITRFKGLRISDFDASTPFPAANAEIPFDCAYEAQNIDFLKTGGFRRRFGMRAEATVFKYITGEALHQFWQIKQLNGIEYADRWLYLSWDGIDGRIYDSGTAGPSPILTIRGMKYAFVLNAFNRVYISPWSDWGVALITTTTVNGNMIWVHEGNLTARPAQYDGSYTGGPLAAAGGGAGNVTAGLHYIGVAFQTSSGYISFIPVQTTVTAAGGTVINLTGIPIGGTGVVDRWILMSKIVVNLTGGTLGVNIDPYFVGSIGDNTTTTYSINVPDSGLVDRMDNGFTKSSRIPSCVTMAVYNNRLVYNGVRVNTVSPPTNPENVHSVLISPPGLPEDVSDSNNDGSKLLIGQQYTGKVVCGAELRGTYFIFKDDSTFAIIDNPELEPQEWPIKLIDSGLGAYPLGIVNISDNPGSLVLDNLLVSNRSGIHRFDGAFDPVPISLGWWDFVSSVATAKFVSGVADPVRKKLFFIVGDPAGTNRYIYVGDYHFGLSDGSIRWGRYLLPAADTWFGWAGGIPGICLTWNDSVAPYPLLTILSKDTATQLPVLYKFKPTLTMDQDFTPIPWDYTTGYTPNEYGELYTYAYIRARVMSVTEVGQEPSVDFSYAPIDSASFTALSGVTPGTAPAKYMTIPISQVHEQIKIKVSGDQDAIVHRLGVFISERAKDRVR